MYAMTSNPCLQSLEGFFERLIQQVRIDLRGGNLSVSERLLNDEDVRGASIQTSCETVPETVRCDAFINSCFDNPLIETALDLTCGNSFLQLAEEESLAFSEDFLASFQIAVQDRAQLGIEKAIHDLSALGLNGDSLLKQTDIRNIQVNQLGQPDAGLQEEVDDYEITLCLPAFLGSDSLQKHAFLVLDQEHRRLSVIAFDLNTDGGIAVDLSSVGQPAKEAFYRSPGAIDGRGLFELTIELFSYRPRKKEAIDVSGCDISGVVVAVQMFEQQIQVSLLCSNRMWRPAVGKLVIYELFNRLFECHDSFSGLNSSRGCQLHTDWLVMNKRTLLPMYSLIGSVILRSPTSWKVSLFSWKLTSASELSYRNDFTSTIRSSNSFSVMLSLLLLFELVSKSAVQRCGGKRIKSRQMVINVTVRW